MTEQGFSADRIDTSRPHPARMYDYFLGGQDNYEVDRQAAEQLLQLGPGVVASARGNREFLQRAVRAVAEDGIDQFIDIGTGIPTSPNTHEIARSVTPDARVVYADNDPIVATYAGAKLTNTGKTGFILGDLREPDVLLGHPVLRELVDFGRPVALLLVAVLHFVRDEEDPAALVAALTERLPAGSRLVLSHATGDLHDDEDLRKGTEVYRRATASMNLRSRDQVLRLFEGFDVQDPGVVQVPLWRPDGPVPEGEKLRQVALYGAVGVKR